MGDPFMSFLDGMETKELASIQGGDAICVQKWKTSLISSLWSWMKVWCGVPHYTCTPYRLVG